MKQSKHKKEKRSLKMMGVLLALGLSIVSQAQQKTSTDALIGEWVFDRMELEETFSNRPNTKRSTYTDLADVQAKTIYPFTNTITSLMVMPDNLNLNTIELALLDAPFRLKMQSGKQVLEVDDNRPEDQREQASHIYTIKLEQGKLRLSAKYFYATPEGVSAEGLLTTTLVRP